MKLGRQVVTIYLLALYLAIPCAASLLKRIGVAAGAMPQSNAEQYHQRTNQFLKKDAEEIDYAGSKLRWTFRSLSACAVPAETVRKSPV